MSLSAAVATRTSSPWPPPISDRKSTRLNSSHVEISYAVFCLKKKDVALELLRGAVVRPAAGQDLLADLVLVELAHDGVLNFFFNVARPPEPPLLPLQAVFPI